MAWFDASGGFHTRVGNNRGPFADIESSARENIDFGGLQGVGVGLSHSHDINLIPSRPLAVHANGHISLTDGYLSTAAVSPGLGWVNLYGLVHRSSKIEQFGMVKAQYSNARVGCVQMLATTNKVAGVSLLAPVSSKVALGFEYYYSLAHKDRTFCLGAQYSSPTHSVASQQPHHQHHHTTQATFTVSSFGQLATTLSHPVSLPSLDASLSASVRTTFTVPPPADMRLGARPDPPLVTAGVSYLPNRQIWNVRATVTPQQLRGRLQVEATPRKNSVVTAHLDASPNHVGWGLRGSVSF